MKANQKLNWYDSYRGVVHLTSFNQGNEFTLCGLAFDEPSSEHGGERMVYTDKPCTCAECAKMANILLPYLKKEVKRIKDTIELDWKNP